MFALRVLSCCVVLCGTAHSSPAPPFDGNGPWHYVSLGFSEVVDGGDKRAVVAATVTEVGERKGCGVLNTGVLKVTHVYSGPKTLNVGALFVVDGAAKFDWAEDASVAVPLLKVGEEGTWNIYRSKNGEWHGWMHIRKCHDSYLPWEDCLEWAESLEKLEKLPMEKRLTLAKELCSSKTRIVAQLGVEVLFGAFMDDSKEIGAREFLELIGKNKSVSLWAVVRADLIFLDQFKRKWVENNNRKSIVERLSTEVYTDKVGVDVCFHLTSPYTIRSFNLPELSDPLSRIALNSKQPVAVRNRAVESLGSSARLKQQVGDAKVFETLIDVLKNDPSQEVRNQAARQFVRFAGPPIPPNKSHGKLSPEQIAVLRDLEAAEKNENVKKTLRMALEKLK